MFTDESILNFSQSLIMSIIKNTQKIFTILTLLAVNSLIIPRALAQTELTNISSVLENPVEGQEVTLRGKIIEQIEGSSDYIFTDGTNKIIIHLEDEELSYNPDTMVEIVGKVEVDPEHLEEVEHDHASEELEIVVDKLTVVTADN